MVHGAAARPMEIGLLLYPGCQIAMVHGMTDLLDIANYYSRARGGPILQCRHWRLTEAGAVEPIAEHLPDGETSPDIVIVPGRLTGPVTASEAAAYRPWLNAMHGNGAILASSCDGAFLLAESGLLDGRAVTTHWVFADDLRRRFPRVIVQPDRIVIDDGDLITAGGLMAWTDLGLRIVDRLLGPTVMLEAAQFFLVDPGGREQRHYSHFLPRLTHGDAPILRVQQWLPKADLSAVTVGEMARHAELEERTFLRRFKSATGMRPTDYVRQLRVSRARELLQFTRQPVDQIAWTVGYEDPSAFRRAFMQLVGLSPGDYRRRFAPEKHLRSVA